VAVSNFEVSESHTIGLFVTSVQPIAEVATYTIKTQETNVEAVSVIRTHDLRNQYRCRSTL
jgi:hypothetical protein